MCLVCCTQETFILHVCCIYRIIEKAPHMCHTHADEVCTHLSKVCTMCALVMCSMHAVGYVQHACSWSCAGSIHAAYEQLHTFCMHVFCTPHVLVCGIHVAHFNFCIFSTHEKKMPCMCSKVTGMYAACMQHVCCMPNMCSEVGDIYTPLKMGCTTYTHGCTTCQSKMTLPWVYRKGVYVPSRVYLSK